MSSIINDLLYRIGRKLITPDLAPVLQDPFPCSIDPATQKQLWLRYKFLSQEKKQKIRFSDVGWKSFSQTDEDGILLYILSILGEPLRKSVEICAGDGRECNTANLLINHYWTGLLVDGDAGNVCRGKDWYQKHPSTYVFPPTFVCEWITRSNVNQVVSDHGFTGEIDVLSIDVDGVDYWLWEALDVISPRVVVIEYQCHLGPERSWTVPYSDDFRASDYPKTNGWLPNFAGASLRALAKLGREKGYRLIGCNALGFNAFFVRNDLAQAILPEVPIDLCFSHPRVQWSMEERFPEVENMNWQEV